jgi:predicted DNA-binding transcriptional regulator AlpA
VRAVEDLWGVTQIAERLGRSRQWVAELVSTEGFPEPAYRLGASLGWLPDDVRRWARLTGRDLREP